MLPKLNSCFVLLYVETLVVNAQVCSSFAPQVKEVADTAAFQFGLIWPKGGKKAVQQHFKWLGENIHFSDLSCTINIWLLHFSLLSNANVPGHVKKCTVDWLFYIMSKSDHSRTTFPSIIRPHTGCCRLFKDEPIKTTICCFM